MTTLTTHDLVKFLQPMSYVSRFIEYFIATDTVQRTVILAYHSISRHRNLRNSFYYSIEPRLFDSQMKYLHENDFKVINLSEWVYLLKRHNRVHYKTIVLTFDDGYADTFLCAYPTLKAYGFSATVFLISNFVNSKNIFPWLREPPFPRGENLPLSVDQILDMAEGGMDFGSHTLSHHRLTGLSNTQAFEEVQGAKAYLEELLGREINSFSFPYGSFSDFDRSHQEMVRKAGYQLAVTSIYGSNDANSNPLSLRRIPIYGNDDLNTFAMKVNGHYDWIGRVQRLLSLFRTIM